MKLLFILLLLSSSCYAQSKDTIAFDGSKQLNLRLSGDNSRPPKGKTYLLKNNGQIVAYRRSKDDDWTIVDIEGLLSLLLKIQPVLE